MRFLIIDDSPGRYDTFTRMLDREKIKWVMSCDPQIVDILFEYAGTDGQIDGILLDHDMPYKDGREWAKWIEANIVDVPVVVTSTTGLPNVREEMIKTLKEAKIPAYLCPADHINCEIEWLAWLKGAIETLNKDSIDTNE